MPLPVNILLLVVGFVLLMKGADVFVDGSSSLAGKLGIPQIVIGLTIVAFGTSAPEAAISITAGIKGSAELAVSNVVGSNILNVLLILGIASVITPLAVKKNTLFIEIPFVAVITIVLLVLGMNGYSLSRFDGVILTILFLIFMGYLVYISLKKKDEEEEEVKKLPTWLMILYIIFGGAAIVGGSQLTVNSATAIAKYFGMSDRLIGLTIVALGTSLPELITSVTAACKHNADIAIGNIVGSNIFNILFVQTFWIPLTTGLKIRTHIYLKKLIFPDAPSRKPAHLTKRGNKSSQCNNSCIAKQGRNFSNPPYVFITVLIRKFQIRIDSMSNVISV